MTGCGSFHVQVLKSELWYRVFVPLLNRALDVAFYSFGILGALIDLVVCSESRYAGDAKPAEPSRQKVDLVAMARRRYQRPRVNSLGEGPTKRWSVRCRQDEVDGSGKRVRVCKQTKLGLCSEMTRAQAQRAADELLGRRANSLQPPPQSPLRPSSRRSTGPMRCRCASQPDSELRRRTSKNTCCPGWAKSHSMQ
jgi:hypothetical protein